MGRIVTSVMVSNVLNPERYIRCDALVDTGASHMVLPLAWREQLGELDAVRTLPLETAIQTHVEGEVCGPVKIQVEGFRPVYGEVLFVEMMRPRIVLPSMATGPRESLPGCRTTLVWMSD